MLYIEPHTLSLWEPRSLVNLTGSPYVPDVYPASQPASNLYRCVLPVFSRSIPDMQADWKKGSMSFGSMHTVSSSEGNSGDDQGHQLVIDSEEIFPNPIVSKKGYINVFDQPHNRNRWTKCYVVGTNSSNWSALMSSNMGLAYPFNHIALWLCKELAFRSYPTGQKYFMFFARCQSRTCKNVNIIWSTAGVFASGVVSSFLRLKIRM